MRGGSPSRPDPCAAPAGEPKRKGGAQGPRRPRAGRRDSGRAGGRHGRRCARRSVHPLPRPGRRPALAPATSHLFRPRPPGRPPPPLLRKQASARRGPGRGRGEAEDHRGRRHPSPPRPWAALPEPAPRPGDWGVHSRLGSHQRRPPGRPTSSAGRPRPPRGRGSRFEP